jgi:hypothetical protein
MAIVACFVFQREISRSVFWDFFDSIDPLRKWSALTASATNLRIVPSPLYLPDDYLGSIELLIAIVLGCMRWKSAQAHQVRQ